MTLIEYDESLTYDGKLVGVDEAGRGPLAGPVTASACYIPNSLYTHPIMKKINDSKKLSPKQREEIFEELTKLPIIYATGYASAKEIDNINILQATFLAMRRALQKFNNQKIFVLVDGNKTIPNLQHKQQYLIKGDATSLSVASASIIAKVSRDRFMTICSKLYPNYLFEGHKGYGTAEHIALIQKYGICPIHRKTFEPISSMFFGLFSNIK